MSCLLFRIFWFDVLIWWNFSFICNILFDEFKILYGYNFGDLRCFFLNYYILIVKFYIFRYKIDFKFFIFLVFMVLLKEKLFVYKVVVVVNKIL